MRFFEISSGLRLPVSQEEQELLDLMTESDDGRISKASLDERQEEVSRLMVSRGLLVRIHEGDHIFFRPNDATDVWRF